MQLYVVKALTASYDFKTIKFLKLNPPHIPHGGLVHCLQFCKSFENLQQRMCETIFFTSATQLNKT